MAEESTISIPHRPATFCQCIDRAKCCLCGKLARITAHGHNFCWDCAKIQPGLEMLSRGQ
jgi:hypothetical protein